MQNLRNKKNKLMENRLTDVEDNQAMPEGMGVGRLGESVEKIKKYKLVVDR